MPEGLASGSPLPDVPVNVDGVFSACYLVDGRTTLLSTVLWGSHSTGPTLERLGDLNTLFSSMPTCDVSQPWSTSTQPQVSLLLEVKPGVDFTTTSLAC